MTNINDLAAMSGENDYKNKPVRSNFDEIKIGPKGTFVLTEYTGEKDTDGLFPSADLGTSVDIIILKLRRKMVEFMDRTFIRGSNEYNTATQEITLSSGEKGTEKDLKKQFPGIKVQIVLYALLDGTVAKIPVSGSSLYSDDPAKPQRLYNYLQSFNEGEHVIGHVTRLQVTNEERDTGEEIKTYHAISFSRVSQVPEAQLDHIGNVLTDLIGDLAEHDKRFGESFGKKKEAEDQKQLHYPTAEEEGINPADVPF